MSDADINLHPDLIELVDGDVSIPQILTVLGKLVARAGIEVFTTAGQLALDINESTGNAQFNKTLSVFGKLFARAGFDVRTSSNEQVVDVDSTTGVVEFAKTVTANGSVNVGSLGDSGEVFIKDANNNVRIDLSGSDSTVLVHRSDGTAAAKIYASGIQIFDPEGNLTIDLSSSNPGTHKAFQDLEFTNDADIKLNGFYVGALLDYFMTQITDHNNELSDIRTRLNTLEGYHP